MHAIAPITMNKPKGMDSKLRWIPWNLAHVHTKVQVSKAVRFRLDDVMTHFVEIIDNVKVNVAERLNV